MYLANSSATGTCNTKNETLNPNNVCRLNTLTNTTPEEIEINNHHAIIIVLLDRGCPMLHNP
jgi:hypothetical protein